MRKKWLLVALLLLAGFALACPAGVRWPRPGRYTKDTAGRVHDGMTEAEVVAVMGKPPGDYASPGTGFVPDDWGSGAAAVAYSKGVLRLEGGGAIEGWIDDAGAVCVEFDREGRVRRCWWEPVFAPTPTPFLDLVRRLFK